VRFVGFGDRYSEGIARDPTLAGNVTVKFVIDTKGKVQEVSATDATTLDDQAVVECVKRVFESMKFPPPFGGDATVTVPATFLPGPLGPK
jgi:TonB family protein